MSFTKYTRSVSFASFSILIHGLSISLPVSAYFKESPIEVTSNQLNRSSESHSDRRERDRYLSSKDINTAIEEDFNAGNKNFESGQYQQAAKNYTDAIYGLKLMKTGGTSDIYYGSERYRLITTNLISCYENRSLTYMKLYSAYSTYNKDRALQDLGEAVELYQELGDRVNAFETIQNIRRIGGNEAANKYTY
jgi:hypothetical protein